MKERIVLRNSLSEIDRLAEWVSIVGKKRGLCDDVIHEARLTLEEIVVNIIVHGYGKEAASDAPIEIEMDVVADLLSMQVKDQARPFNPVDAPEPDLDVPFEDREIGGLGIVIVRRLIDSVDYSHEDGRNVLTMKKRIGRVKT